MSLVRLSSTPGDGQRPFLENPLTLSSGAGDPREIWDVTMPYGINMVCLKERFQILQFLVGYKSHGSARPSHPPGPSRPVRVGFQAIRIIIINHMTDMAEVKPPAGDVRGNHQGDLVLAKPLIDRSSSRLLQTSVDILNRSKLSLELFFQRLTVMS